MTTVLDWLRVWGETIAAMFKEHPIIAAVLSLLAIGAFLALEKWRNDYDEWARRSLHFIAVFLGWAILVPIVGFVADVVIGGATAIWSFIVLAYDLYRRQPILVLSLLGICGLALLVWELLRRNRPHWIWKGALCLILWIVLCAIAVPLADALGDKPRQATTSNVQLGRFRSSSYL